MLEWLRKWWPWWPWTPDDVPEPTNPILLVPGICGTQLAVRSKAAPATQVDSGKLIWVCIEHADAEYKKLWGRVDPKTKYLHLLDTDLEVVVPTNPKADDGGLYSVDILDPSLYVPLHVVYYFHNLIWYLEKHKYVAAQTLFGFGYDFRQSNMSHLDALVKQLEIASKAAGGAKVDVVSHSMGGLVVKCLLSARPDDYKRLVNKWIAIAAPFGGAPGFGTDALMTGVQFAQGWKQYFFVERSTMQTMCAQAPAVFELLSDPKRADIFPPDRKPPSVSVVLQDRKPDAQAAAEEDGDRAGGRRESSNATATGSNGAENMQIRKVTYSLADFRNLMKDAMKGYKTQTYDNKEVLMEMNPACWAISDATRASWRTAAIPEGTEFYNIFGTGFQTAYDVMYGSEENPLSDVTDIVQKSADRTFTMIDGDSTVPVCCATADGLNATDRKGYFATHRGLLELPDVWEQVMQYIHWPGDPADSGDKVPRSHRLHAKLRSKLRSEAEHRTQAHREAWDRDARLAQHEDWRKGVKRCVGAHGASAKASARAGSSGVGDDGDWVLVSTCGAPARSHPLPEEQ